MGFYADREKLAYGSVGRPPRINPAITEIANSTIATKNTIFAVSMATPAIIPKPSNAAISAIIRNVTAQPNMRFSSPRSRYENPRIEQRHLFRFGFHCQAIVIKPTLFIFAKSSRRPHAGEDPG